MGGGGDSDQEKKEDFISVPSLRCCSLRADKSLLPLSLFGQMVVFSSRKKILRCNHGGGEGEIPLQIGAPGQKGRREM